MKIELNIKDSHILIILLILTTASAIGLVVGYGGTNPSTMGHTLSEINLNTPVTFGGAITVNQGWSPNHALTIDSNQIWKSVSGGGDPNLYLQYNTEGGGVVIGDNAGAANPLYVRGGADIRDTAIANDFYIRSTGKYVSQLVTWGSPCYPVWTSSCSCCDYYGATIYCNYMGRELAVGGTSVCLYTPSSQGSCGSQWCPADSSCCYYG